MPTLDVSELNIVLGVLVKIKCKWYLGEALPAVLIGILLGPLAAKFIDSERWGSATEGQTSAITLGLARVMIGVQLVIAGYQLPAKYQQLRWKEMALCLLPIMTIMWLSTTVCMLATVPKITLLAALVIGSCVTCTDPILSQAIAKGPFADKFVARDLREIISSEAGANDGFGFPFLMLAVYLIRHADIPGAGESNEGTASIAERAVRLVLREEHGVGRLGGGVGVALTNWFVETWLYIVLMSVAIGVVVGFASGKALKFALRKQWVDSESYLLYPTAIGLWLVGICGMLGTDDLLACFVAGNAMNWDGDYLAETEKRHDEVNSCVDVLLNFGGFMYIGTIMPWDQFNQPDVTGLTYPRLFALGFLVMAFRRIPAIMISYKLMPKVEHTRHLFPELGQGDEEETNLVRVMIPVVYWLVLFSIVFHGLSIPALNLIYKFAGVKPIQEDAVELRRISMHVPTPNNAMVCDRDTFIAYNRFSRPVFNTAELPYLGKNAGPKMYTHDDKSFESLGK
ncbi:sodium hydrogen exchanger family protein [Colletotrichum karsti]|uniref:Sodium hydrogen exchanger family protein n=1 Tax=Colletotrichum karsti TaxID=1095194 RepID=A0A9P6LPA3_9PEZI|nr:sodium hydrogen exchanger family protein [Colletotrichum karsti]KAF9880873.1 sodium hydrogen exchanger family protein [Colletotrichum karsti]